MVVRSGILPLMVKLLIFLESYLRFRPLLLFDYSPNEPISFQARYFRHRDWGEGFAFRGSCWQQIFLRDSTIGLGNGRLVQMRCMVPRETSGTETLSNPFGNVSFS